MPNGQFAQVRIITEAVKDISFTTAASYFAYLDVISAGGISLQQKIATTSGTMAFTFNGGNLVLGSSAEFESTATMTLTSGSSSYSMTGSNPVRIIANGDLTMNTIISNNEI